MRLGKKNGDDAAAVMAALKRSDPGPFNKALKEVFDSGGGKIFIMKRTGVSAVPGKKGEVEVSDAVMLENFFEYVQKTYKDGIYTFKIFDSKTNIHSQHHFGLGDIKSDLAKAATAEDTDKAAKKENNSLVVTMMEMQSQQLQNLTEQNTALMIKLADSSHNNNGFGMKEALEMQSRAHEQTLALLSQGGNSSLDEALAIIEISQRLQPQIEKDDPLTTLMSSLLPMFVAAKSGGGGGGGVDGNLIKQISGAVNQYQQSAGPSSPVAGSVDQPPAPGSPQTPNPQTGLSGPGDDPSTGSTPAVAGSQEYFLERFVQPFQADVTNGQTDEELAYQIIAMTMYARDRMADQPPPLVAEFLLSKGMMEYDAALTKFFSRLPELANLRQKCESIRQALIRMFMSGEEMPDINDIEKDLDEVEDEVQERSEEEVQEQIEQEEVEEVVADSGTIEHAEVTDGE